MVVSRRCYLFLGSVFLFLACCTVLVVGFIIFKCEKSTFRFRMCKEGSWMGSNACSRQIVVWYIFNSICVSQPWHRFETISSLCDGLSRGMLIFTTIWVFFNYRFRQPISWNTLLCLIWAQYCWLRLFWCQWKIWRTSFCER